MLTFLQFNQPLAVSEDLQLPYTMDSEQTKYPYHVALMTTTVNRALPSFIPEIVDESKLTINEALKFANSDGMPTSHLPLVLLSMTALGSVSIPLFDTMTDLVARINNRVIFGTELCRRKDFIHSVVRFSETTPLIATFVTWSPFISRKYVFKLKP
jgi:hypothetical protein